MKKNCNNESGVFNRRTLLAFVLALLGFMLGLASIGNGTSGTNVSSGARIYVTTTADKVSGIGSGGCSLQEAIYSSVLHDSLDGGAHGIAIDTTDPEHFITTECVMGTGNGDTIILPTGAVFQLGSFVFADVYNYMGPTATPMIFSTMTIEASGATLKWIGSGNSRLFAIGQATVKTPNGTASGAGAVTIRNAYIKGFHVRGGDGAVGGGGGGLGAGGAIYVQQATLVVENSTFDTNSAVGGDGDTRGSSGGGGGGLSGNGGELGGGGGSRGNGGFGVFSNDQGINAGGGGGTVSAGGQGSFDPQIITGVQGYRCGGYGGYTSAPSPDGSNATCAGGGGGGGGSTKTGGSCIGGTSGDGGSGAYGGGGGGGSGNGGNGGFGGGGGGGDGDGCGGDGGNGDFGGGGGWGTSLFGPGPGKGGPFGGNATGAGGGGGGALGGAIFNESGQVTVHNCTFTNNSVARGVGARNGGDAGGAIFSMFGTLNVVNSTISGNQSTGSGGGLVVYTLGAASFTLQNTIIANNGANECFVTGNVTTSGAGNLIINNGSGTQPFGTCPGVVTTVDPQLQTLQPPSTNGGKTPTMAIPLFSSAMGMADAATSFKYDQRYDDRPQPDKAPRTGYDIGAYEVCRMFRGPSLVSAACRISLLPPPTTTLTMQASPSTEGTTNPPPGNNTVDQGSVVSVQAIPNSSCHFVNWTGQVTDPNNASTTVIMSQPWTVTANFAVSTPTPIPTPTPTPSSTPCRFRCGPTPTPTPPSSPTPTPPRREPIPNTD